MNISSYALPIAAVAGAGLVALSPLRSVAAYSAVAVTGAFVFSPMWLILEQPPSADKIIGMKIVSGFSGFMMYSSIVNGLLNRTVHISPERIRWVLCGIGTGSAGAIFALRNLVNYGGYTRWDRKTVISQALFSCAVGILFTGLFGYWIREKVSSQTEKLANTPSKNPPEMSSLLANPAELDTLDIPSFVGNQAIVNLQRALVLPTGNYEISPAMENAEYSLPFRKDNWQKICQNLGPYDLIQLARVCRYLYKTICGPSGAPIWLHQGIGSINTYKNLCLLPRAIESEMVKRNTDIPFLIKAEIFRRALYLAYPDQLLARFDKNVSQANLKNYRNLRNNPELLEIRHLPDFSDRVAVFISIIHFGLPVNAVEPFQTQVKALMDQHGIHCINTGLLKAIKRIITDHPAFDLRSFFSTEELYNEFKDQVLGPMLSMRPDMYLYRYQIQRYLPN
jgi:hypothetical protein